MTVTIPIDDHLGEPNIELTFNDDDGSHYVDLTFQKRQHVSKHTKESDMEQAVTFSVPIDDLLDALTMFKKRMVEISDE